jgi:hypothetical protein
MSSKMRRKRRELEEEIYKKQSHFTIEIKVLNLSKEEEEKVQEIIKQSMSTMQISISLLTLFRKETPKTLITRMQ